MTSRHSLPILPIESEEAADRFHDECGVMAVWNVPDAANLTYLGLYAQQHRGQEGAGVVALNRLADKPSWSAHRGLGLVQDVFRDFDFEKLKGNVAIGHVRYSTAGGQRLANVQPFSTELSLGEVAISHNGNLVNALQLRAQLMKQGAIFTATSDTEIVLHLLSRARTNVPLIESVIETLKPLRGAFSFALLFKDRLFAIRDPHGLRPLVLGSLQGGVVVASETCALDLIGAQYLREVEPGEIVEISGENSFTSYRPFPVTTETPCIFEHVYFARPDSRVFGRDVYSVRKRMGMELAREHPAVADFVIPVPDSGMIAANGYAQQSGIPFELALIRNHYVGRTFIEPEQGIRDFGVKIKLNPNPELLRGKSVVVVDDSIVRGTTSRKLVNMLRQAGAREVHMRISSPPTTDPCHYGIDTPGKSELIAARCSTEEIRQMIGADTLAYLSIEGLYRAVGSANGERPTFCDACFSGRYPAGTPDNFMPKQGTLL